MYSYKTWRVFTYQYKNREHWFGLRTNLLLWTQAFITATPDGEVDFDLLALLKI
jgi:hypothetical protein